MVAISLFGEREGGCRRIAGVRGRFGGAVLLVAVVVGVDARELRLVEEAFVRRFEGVLGVLLGDDFRLEFSVVVAANGTALVVWVWY